MDKNNPSLIPKYKHNYTRSQTITQTMKMCEANIIVSLDYKSKVNILKSRYGIHGDNISLQDTIETLSEMLSRNIFGDYLDMFRESLKGQLIKSINETIKAGVVNENLIS